jgi:hypothetical protein
MSSLNSKRSHKPKTKSHKPKTKSHKPKTKSHKPKTKSHKPKTKSHKPKTKSRKPKTQKTKKTQHSKKSPTSYHSVRKGLSISDWFFKNKKYWLTINDIMKLPPGKPIKLLSLHREVFESCKTCKPKTLYKPSTLFQGGVVTFFRNNDSDLSGKILFKWQKDSLQNPTNFEFDVNLNKDDWYSIKNGIVNDEDKSRHWSELPKKTNVGWKGPMLFWKDIDKLSRVYKKE